MSEIGPTHPLTYRAEIVAPVFDLLRASESAALIGPASMGKSRLLHFLLRGDVQHHYLGDAAAVTWLALADCNRLAEASEWGLYELLLTALTEVAAGRVEPSVRDWLNDLRREAIITANPLLARRHVELATRSLRLDHGLKLCFLLDEFDDALRKLPTAALVNLRALRDFDRYSLCFLLTLRDAPDRVRPPREYESFYELFSRSLLGLRPYTEEDARRVLAQLAVRRQRTLTPAEIIWLLEFSGGHPGLLVALFDLLTRGNVPSGAVTIDWALAEPQVAEECRKLWAGLSQDEQLALSHLTQGIGAAYGARQLLELKGLIRVIGSDVIFFSPVFAKYVATQGAPIDKTLSLDEAAAVAWVEGRRVADLSPLEFELLRLLHRRLGQVCSRDEILAVLYPHETLQLDAAIADNRVDSLMRHLRKAIEPDAGHPRYLLTVRGRGYKLVDTPIALGRVAEVIDTG